MEAAHDLGRQSLRKGYRTLVVEMDSFPVMKLPTTKVVLFIVATTGDGEPPSTMMNTWRFLLRSDLPPNSLKNTKFSVFGLGDSSYELFNAMAKKLTQRLLDLGA